MACKNIILKLIVLSLSEATDFENLGRKLANNRKLRNRRRRKIFLSIRTRKMMLRHIPKNTNFLKTIKEFPDDVFQSHFRMTRSTFQFVANELKPFWKNSNSGRPSIDMRLALYLTLWKLANNCSFREISCLFNIAKGSTFKYFFQTTKLLFKLRKMYIKWPDSIHEQLKIMNSFASLRNNPFPNVLGCVDGTQIPIIAPKTDPTSYFNRKGTFSINMQDICDHNQKFIDICFGYPGSCHDASVWERSSIGKALQSGSKKIMQDGNILGDSAYPLNLYLMVPYRDNGYLTATQKTYNFVHSSTRVCIEQAFGRLKSMFRILKFIDIKNLEYAKYIALACVVLHNIIILQEKDLIPDSFTETQNLDHYDMSTVDDHQLASEVSNEAKAKRNRIAMLFSS